MADKQGDSIALIPAATVVLVSDAGSGLKTLMLRRNAKLDFAGGNWVFPGGRIDPADYDPGNPEDQLLAAQNAAVRETLEEAGLDISRENLTYFSHWVAPALMPKRFTTWFFFAHVKGDPADVQIDGGEIHEYQWLSPAEVLARSAAQEMSILPPTLVTLNEMNRHGNVEELLSHYSGRDAFVYEPHVYAGGEGDGRYIFMYQGDAGYDSMQPDTAGKRHRVSMIEGAFVYENDL